MGWKRKIHCSWCGSAGHNKTTCTDRKKYAAERPTGFVAEEIRMEEARKTHVKTCSYCEVQGHTRRTCKLLKSDKAQIIARRNRFLRDYEHHAKKLGLGPGALVKVPTGSRKDPFESWIVVMVTGYDTSGFDYRPQYQDVTRAYSLRSRKVLRARIVSVHNFPDAWTMPAIGDQWDLNSDCMLGLMPELWMPIHSIPCPQDVDDLWNTTVNCYTSLVAPVKDVRFPEWEEITDDLTNQHRLKPHPTAGYRQKRRLRDVDPDWRGLYEGMDKPEYPDYEGYI